MIDWIDGDLFADPADALVNPVNCVGVMGRGLALEFRRASPAMERAYADACRRGRVQPGRMFVFETGLLVPPRLVVNFPTKRHWRDLARIEDIALGLEALVQEIEGRAIRSIAVPALGAGLGGLSWDIVRPRIEDTLGRLDAVRVRVYLPRAGPTSSRGP